jgi:hypothetical protein
MLEKKQKKNKEKNEKTCREWEKILKKKHVRKTNYFPHIIMVN